MKIDEIEIFSGTPDFAYEEVRRLEVKCEATNALMPAPTIEEANGRLRALAAKVGANAIIQADYNSGISFTSWKSLKATGLAVRRISDDMPCPVCAETIKRAAKKCRYCGADIVQEASIAAEPAETVRQAPMQAHSEPLTDNNNPVMIIMLAGVALFVLFLMIGAG